MLTSSSPLPAPVIELHEGFQIVRDDLLPGGTKRRAIPVFFSDEHDEYIYASPVQGAAQLALALTAREHGKRATIFCAKRKTWHPNTTRVHELGGKIVEVPMGYLTVVTARAREYAAQTGACLLPFGLDDERMIAALADVAHALGIAPREVWSVASSGVLTRALQRAWPDATFYGVQVGHCPPVSKATILTCDEPFERDARMPPPFPSCSNYDAKVWQHMKRQASPGALFWNVSV